MAPLAPHLELEREVLVALRSPQAEGADCQEGEADRSRALIALNQWASDTQGAKEPFQAGARLASAALGVRFSAAAELSDGADSLTVHWSDRTTEQGGQQELSADSTGSALAFALSVGHPIVFSDAGIDERFRDEFLLERGALGGIVCPVAFAKKRYGAIGVFTDTKGSFSREDVLFLQTVSSLIGPRLAHARAEQTLLDHSRLISATIDSLDSMVLLLTADGRIMRFNRACQRLSGFAIKELKNREVCSAFVPEEEAKPVRDVLSELRDGGSEAKCETTFLTKHGDRHRVAWSFSSLPALGNGPAVVASGIDVTEYRDVLLRLDQARREAQEAAKDATAAAPLGAGAAQPGPASDVAATAGSVESSEEDYKERRGSERRPYPCVQSIAPYRNGRTPTAEEFWEVRCYDISEGGISFFLPREPDFDEVVVAFGSSPVPLYLIARIAHISRVEVEGRDERLVGCQYTGRIEQLGDA